MEIHSVLPEERAKDPKGDTLPWGYRYADSSRNVRQPPEESGPFGRSRSVRYTSGARTSRGRTGTTPVRQKEDPTVMEFGRLFAKEQAKEEQEKTRTASSTSDQPRAPEQEAIPTECLIYGYAGKSSEWKVLSKYEKIVAPSYICEDYSREDPNLFLSSNSPMGFSRSAIVLHKDLSKEAIQKSRIYKGGQHWIKVTFDSYPAAERACFYSPLEIDGHMVYCEIWQGRGPPADVPLLKGSETQSFLQSNSGNLKTRTIGPAQSSRLGSGKDSAIAGFERAMQTLPRSAILPDMQYGQPSARDDTSVTSTTASSATATAPDLAPQQSDLRARSVPHLPSQVSSDPTSEYMTHIPSVKKAVLRPISEALPPQPSFFEKLVRSLPIVSRFASNKSSGGGLVGDGPLLKEDGTWDPNNGWYWTIWHSIDWFFSTDFCALKEE